MNLKDNHKTATLWLFLLILFSPIISNQTLNSISPTIEIKKGSSHSSAVILQYHHIANDTPYSTSTSLELFKQQMELLDRLQFKVWPLTEIISRLQTGESLPDRVVALTFDDAYSSFYSNAWPILKRYRFPATLFVATSHISDKTTEYLSWQQLRELSKQGVTIGSHSDSHNFLARQLYLNNNSKTTQLIIDDLKISLQKISQHLDINTKLFAYPYGEYSDALVKVIKQLKLIGFGQHSGPINQYSNFSALPRFPASNQFGSVESLLEKLYTLPFNQILSQPTETFILNNPPQLTLKISDKTLDVQCYAPNQGKIPSIKTLFTNFQQLKIQATSPLEKGRSRYNCTAKANGGYFYWFSQPWIILQK